MKIDISDHDLKFVLFSLKAQYNYWNELKEKTQNCNNFDYFWDKANTTKTIHNQLLEYLDVEEIKNDPFLVEQYKKI